jgi:transglutaminase-like putative cysteine protease
VRSKKNPVPRDVFALLLTLALVMLSGVSLTTADWVDHLVIVPAVGVLGVAAGAALAWSRFGPALSGLLATVYGLFAIGWQVGQVLDPALIWRERLVALGGRLVAFAGVVVRGDTNPDLLIFVVLMALLFWILGVNAGWSVFRRAGLWRATLPPGLALLVNAFYYIGPVSFQWYIASYVLFVLILALRLNLLRRREAWQAGHSQVPPGASQMIGRGGLAAALALVLLAWGGPAFAQSQVATDMWVKLSGPWQGVRDRIGEAFGRLRSPLVRVSDVYGDSLSLSAGFEPADYPVMDIQPEREPNAGGRFYWRSRVFDRYEGGRWTTTLGELTPFDPGQGDLRLPRYAGREVIAFDITPHVPALRALYVASQPVWVSRSAYVALADLPDGNVDPLIVLADIVLVEGETYRVRSSIAVPTADELRAAGQAYPEWLIETYLQVPESISPRVVQLALEVTQDADTPYDKAAAVTAWMRRNISYNRATEAPPEGEEPVEWLLFDYQVGFCDYYATAEVILLRALGIPARLAAGYARGHLDRERGVYEVRGADAHTWPEVFFPGYGWVEFEPTVEQPSLVRPGTVVISSGASSPGAGPAGRIDEAFFDDRTEAEFFPGQEPIAEASEAPAVAGGWRVGWWVVGVLLALAGGIGIWFMADPYSQAMVAGRLARRLRRMGLQPPKGLRPLKLAATSPTSLTYFRWTLWLARLRFPLQPAQTPHERAAAFSTWMPEGEQASRTLVDAYAAERFGNRPPDVIAVRQAWRSLAPRLWIAWIRRALERLRDPRAALRRVRDAQRGP